MRRPKESSHKPDYVLLAVAGFLVLLGIIALTSVSTAFSLVQKGSTVFYLSWHISFGVLGGSILGLLAYKISLSRLKTKSPQLLFLNLFLMLLVFLPKIGVTSGGAKRWIDLGFSGHYWRLARFAARHQHLSGNYDLCFGNIFFIRQLS